MESTQHDSDTLLSRGQAAALLGLSPERVRQLAAAGALPSQRTPLGRLFRLADIEAYAASRYRRHHPQQAASDGTVPPAQPQSKENCNDQ